MLRYVEAWARGWLVWLKFRSVRLGAEGIGCVYRSMSSNFTDAGKITLGDHVHVGPGALFDAAGTIEIGEGCILAPGVKIFSRSHNFDQHVQALPFDNVVLVAPVRIGRYVWVGTDAIILPGVTIGDGAVIGAGAVVAKDVPSCGIAVGNPARVVRFRDRDQFLALAESTDPFVYTRFGHAKVVRTKPRTKRESGEERSR